MKLKRIVLTSLAFFSALSLSACGGSDDEAKIKKGKSVEQVTFEIANKEFVINSNDDSKEVFQLFSDNRIAFHLNKRKGWTGKESYFREEKIKNAYDYNLGELTNENNILNSSTIINDYTYLKFKEDTNSTLSYEKTNVSNDNKYSMSYDLHIETSDITEGDEYFNLEEKDRRPIQTRMDIYYNSSNIIQFEGCEESGALSLNTLRAETNLSKEDYSIYSTFSDIYQFAIINFKTSVSSLNSNEKLDKYKNYKFELTDKYIIFEYKVNFPEELFFELQEDSVLLESYTDQKLDEIASEGYFKYIYYVDYKNIEDSSYMTADYIEYESISDKHIEFIFDERNAVPEEYFGVKYEYDEKLKRKCICYVTNYTEVDYNNFVNKLKK